MCQEQTALKVTVVTVSFNAEKQIENTIISVLEQSYTNMEYIIIDGGSTDGTMSLIRKYEKKIDIIVSEPDKGIYDAMNKGVRFASGEWIIFMNCGDSFYDNSVVKKMCSAMKNNDIVYGQTNVIDSIGQYVLRPRPLECLNQMIMPFFHQSSAVRTELLKRMKFDTRFSLCADFCFFRTCYLNRFQFMELPIVISNYNISEGSQSFDNGCKVYKENFEIEENKKMKSYVRFFLLQSKCWMKYVIYKCVPERYLVRIRRKVVEKNKFLINKTW